MNSKSIMMDNLYERRFGISPPNKIIYDDGMNEGANR